MHDALTVGERLETLKAMISAVATHTNAAKRHIRITEVEHGLIANQSTTGCMVLEVPEVGSEMSSKIVYY